MTLAGSWNNLFWFRIFNSYRWGVTESGNVTGLWIWGGFYFLYNIAEIYNTKDNIARKKMTSLFQYFLWKGDKCIVHWALFFLSYIHTVMRALSGEMGLYVIWCKKKQPPAKCPRATGQCCTSEFLSVQERSDTGGYLPANCFIGRKMCWKIH